MNNEYYGIAMSILNSKVCCLLQIGTGNTKETSNLVERWFPYSVMKHIIKTTGQVNEEIYIRPEQFFKVKIVQGENNISYEFYHQERTEELVSLFEKPDYFEDLDISFL